MFLVEKNYRSFIYYKAQAQLRSEASKTYLSFFWWVLEPIISMAIYYVVFALIFQTKTEDFIPFLLIGLVTWQWFNSIINTSCSSINNNLDLICQLNFPKIILPAVNIVMSTFKFFIVLLILLIFLWLYGFPPSLHYLALPILLLSQHLFNVCIANLVAAGMPFLPDLKIIIDNLLRMAMYSSGVLFSIKQVPEPYQIFFLINPMAVMIDAYRSILMLQQWPDFSMLSIIALASFTGIVLGTLLMKNIDLLYARVLMQK